VTWNSNASFTGTWIHKLNDDNTLYKPKVKAGAGRGKFCLPAHMTDGLWIHTRWI